MSPRSPLKYTARITMIRPRRKSSVILLFVGLCLMLLTATFIRQERGMPSDGSSGLFHTFTLEEQKHVIHIAFVCSEYNSTRDVVTLVKSILFYRKNLLHFHFISDDVAHPILNTVFSTWMVPDIYVSFYFIDELRMNVSLIPDRHHSRDYGLLKLFIPNILPSNLTQVIVLDNDMTFTADIGKLWHLFRLFANKQIIGLVENMGDVDERRRNQPWQTPDRGFDTGVMLLDLSRFRLIDWLSIYNSVVHRVLAIQQYRDLAEQLSEDDECYELKREQLIVYRTHPYYIEYDNSSVLPTDVTLITQLSVDRLLMLEPLCSHWPGPMSLTLYMTDEEAYEFLQYVMHTPALRSRRNIAYHIVYKEGILWAPYFEPYVIVSRNIPVYDERFIGSGWNKVSHIIELDAIGFTFVVTPDTCVIHQPHKRSVATTRLHMDELFRECLKVVTNDFHRYLYQKYGIRASKYAYSLNSTLEIRSMT